MTDIISILSKLVQKAEINYYSYTAVIFMNLVIINCQSSILLKKHDSY
jgi:hypothetical protein